MKQLALTISFLVFAFPVSAEIVSLDRIAAYFENLTTAETRFTQFNGDGSTATGRLAIHRPGRLRFEYDPPTEALVLAAGGQVAIFDAKSNAPPEQYPLRRTPLNLILRRNVEIASSDMVVAHSSDEGITSLVLRDPETPESGTLQLFFSEGPVALVQWIVTDEAGSQTSVALEPFARGMRIPSSQFNIPLEIQRRGL